ncbi:Protein unc-93 homolog A [Gryllus bimaculatus]|nr:Protein unc-93 homolog A [Gryllus bimaculatus]
MALRRWLGCKWAVAVSLVAYMPYIAAHFHAGWATLIPAAAVVGLGGGPLWCAKCTYLTVVARSFSQSSGETSDVVIVRFMGIFFMIFQFAQLQINNQALAHVAVFSTGEEADNKLTGDLGDVCGANYYAPDATAPNATNASPPSAAEINTVAGIYLGCMVLAVLIVALGVDSLSSANVVEVNRCSRRYNEDDREGSGSGLSGVRLLAAFVSCAWGISNIGYVMICYGVVNSVSAVGAGWLVKLTGRMPVVVGATILHAGLLVTLLLWRPHSDDRVTYFHKENKMAMCGILFPGEEEAAFSNFRLWESLGYIVAYAYSAYIITYAKIYVLLVFLAAGVGLYVVIEISEKKRLAKVSP